jgi:hypothetical protein
MISRGLSLCASLTHIYLSNFTKELSALLKSPVSEAENYDPAYEH